MKNEINKICENYQDDENILKLIKIYEKRIGNEINFIHIYLDKKKDVLKNNNILNFILVRNLDYLLYSYNILSQEKINNKEELIKILVIEHFFKRNDNSFQKNDKII